MAVFTSSSTGLWSAGTTWVGGIKPPSASSNSIITAITHVVTYDEANGEYGDDTVTAIQINGELKMSRVTNTQFTCLGQILTAGATTATFNMGRKSIADPIPAGITSTLILNKSGVMANYKYGFFVGDTSNFYACGATKNNNAKLTVGISASDTSAIIDDATGWAVGDMVIFASSDGTTNHYDKKTILTITAGAGTTATITFSAVSFPHATGCPVGNFTSNVTIKNFNTSNYSFLCFRHTSTASNNRREIDYVSLQNLSSNTAQTNTQVFISSGTSALTSPFLSCSHNSLYNGTSSVGIFINAWNSGGFYLDNWSFFTDDGTSGAFVYSASGSFFGVKNSTFYFGTGGHHASAFSQGGQGCLYTDNIYCSSSSSHIGWTNGDGGIFTRCVFHTANAGVAFLALSCGSSQFINCNFGYIGTPANPVPSTWGTPSFPYVINCPTQASKGEWALTDCYFGTPTTAFSVSANIALANPQWIAKIANKNLDPLTQEIYTPNGIISRDNNSIISGMTSLVMTPSSATNALIFTMDVPAPTGKLITVSGLLRRVTTLNNVTVTLSGLGITASVYTASGALSTNETFVCSGTNNTGTDGILTLTFSITGTSGTLFIDALTAPQSLAIDFGQFGYWTKALPVGLVTANQISAGDVWAYLTNNINTTGSIGVLIKKVLTVAKFIGLK